MSNIISSQVINIDDSDSKLSTIVNQYEIANENRKRVDRLVNILKNKTYDQVERYVAQNEQSRN